MFKYRYNLRPRWVLTKLSLIFVVSVFIICGCSVFAQPESSNTYSDKFEAIKKVDASDGIDKAEAYVIANTFFWTNISACGLPLEPEDQGQYWVSKTSIGIAAVPGAPIYIDKISGTATSVTRDNKTKSLSLQELKNWKPSKS